jgi:Leucine-rich repeat (LRR) protein
MKTIIKVLLMISVVAIFSQCEKDDDPFVTIPDNNFLNTLIKLGIDKDGDGIISKVEASEVTFLNVIDCDISNLKGIDAFVNLDTLYCHFNNLTSLDLSNNSSLKFLGCTYNSLTSLDISNNLALKGLGCYNNPLTSLDVSSNSALTLLDCSENSFTSLDISKNTKMLYLTLKSMPSLNKVCVWTMPFPPTGVTVDTTGSPNVYFTTDCSK